MARQAERREVPARDFYGSEIPGGDTARKAAIGNTLHFLEKADAVRSRAIVQELIRLGAVPEVIEYASDIASLRTADAEARDRTAQMESLRAFFAGDAAPAAAAPRGDVAHASGPPLNVRQDAVVERAERALKEVIALRETLAQITCAHDYNEARLLASAALEAAMAKPWRVTAARTKAVDALRAMVAVWPGGSDPGWGCGCDGCVARRAALAVLREVDEAVRADEASDDA